MTYTDKDGNKVGNLELLINDADDGNDDFILESDEGYLVVEKEVSEPKYYQLKHSTDSDESKTHTFFKEILEGYNESNTLNSKTAYKYREYIEDGQEIYNIVETTVITFKVNEENAPMYTWFGMKNGKYHMTAWTKDFSVADLTKVSGLTLKGVNSETTPLDHIPVTVQGSIYDALNKG